MDNLKRKLKAIDMQDLFSSLLWAIIIALIFRSFAFEPFKIPSGSMIPTLQVGDYLFASKYSYGYSRYSFPFGVPLFKGRIFFTEPKRGDIIIFKGMRDPQTFYIKRLIGLPGDIIQMKSGVLHINGKPIDRKYLGLSSQKGVYGENINFKEFLETLEKVEYTARYAVGANLSAFPDTTDEYKVPEAHYFFMGDNRNMSIDSRFDQIGIVGQDRLVGKAAFLFWTKDFDFLKFITNLDTGRAFRLVQ